MHEYIWLFWDIAAVCLLTKFIWTGAAHGLIRTVMGLFGYVAAMFAARSASPVIARTLYDLIVRDALQLVLTRRIQSAAEQGNAATRMADAIPEGLRRIMGAAMPEAAQSAAESGVGGLVATLIDSALREPVLSILQGIAFLLVFTLTLMATRFLARLFTAIYRIPVVGPVNTLLGGALGVAEAVLVLAACALGARLLILFTGGGFFWVNEKIMGDTYVWRVFYNLLVFT